MTGGNKKRRDIEEGRQQAEGFTNRAVANLDPFSGGGQNAFNALSALTGGGANDRSQKLAENAFKQSLFFRGGNNAFRTEKDAIDAALSNQGLLFSQARMNAVEDARQRNFQNAFQQYLNTQTNLAGIGSNAATNQSNAFLNQGNTNFNAGLATANTRQGVLGTLGQIADIGETIGGIDFG